MSLRLQLLQAARLSSRLLGDSAPLVSQFLRAQQNPDGGFHGRDGVSDLYYTAFALDSLAALSAEPFPPVIENYLGGFNGAGEPADFIHLCCLARCRAAVAFQNKIPIEAGETLLRKIESFRSHDGGFSLWPGAPQGSAYGCYLGVAALEDLGAQVRDPGKLVQCLKRLETPAGGWRLDEAARSASTNATAAAVTVLSHLGFPLASVVGEWLMNQRHPQGGFRAAPETPVPDLLTTATTLHALAALEVPLGNFREPCLDFVDSLWTNAGSFHGHWQEDTLDCEYTFYGLLALGHLSL